MYCSNCGVKLSPKSKYCQSCGHLVSPQSHNEDVPPETHISGESSSYQETVNNSDSYLVNEAKKTARGIIKQGILWIAAGAVITGVGYAFAEPGGSYYILWGLMIYGGYKFLQGRYYLSRPQALIDKAMENIKKESKDTTSENTVSENVPNKIHQKLFKDRKDFYRFLVFSVVVTAICFFVFYILGV